MGRPDMAYFSFTDKYFKGEPIRIYNNGDFEHDLYRDFTYIDDVVEGVVRVLNNPPEQKEKLASHRVFNIGNNSPEKLMTFIETLEKALSKALGRKVVFEKIFEPIKPGMCRLPMHRLDLLRQEVGFKPNLP